MTCSNDNHLRSSAIVDNLRHTARFSLLVPQLAEPEALGRGGGERGRRGRGRRRGGGVRGRRRWRARVRKDEARGAAQRPGGRRKKDARSRKREGRREKRSDVEKDTERNEI